MYLTHHWEEIKYGDKTGWVKAMYLNTERPYGADNSKLPEKYGKNSDIKEYKFVPNDGVTFVNVGKYMK